MRELTGKEEEIFSVWRSLAIQQMPYFADILFTVRPYAVPDGTFAVDAEWRLYVCFEFAQQERFSDQEVAEMLLHECMHLFLEHSSRCEKYFGVACSGQDHMLFNYAGDASINGMLTEAGCTFAAKHKEFVLPERFGAPSGLTTEKYADILDSLRKKSQQQQQQQQANQGDGTDDKGGQGQSGQSGQGQQGSGQQPGQDNQGGAQSGQQGGDNSQGQPGQQDSDQGQDQSGQQSGGQGQGGQQGGDNSQGGQNAAKAAAPKRFGGCGSGSGGKREHYEIGPGHPASKRFPGVTDTEKETAMENTATTIRDAGNSGIGQLPGGLVERAEMVLAPPVVPWQKVLRTSIRGIIGRSYGQDEQTFSKAKKRNPVKGLILPGSVSKIPSIVAVRDTSGSMGVKEIEAVTSEIFGIAKKLQIQDDRLKIIDVDCKATEATAFNKKEAKKVKGGGGTDMRVGIAAAEEIRPDAIVVLTDGFTPWPETKPKRSNLVACLVGSEEDVERAAEGVPSFIKVVKVFNS